MEAYCLGTCLVWLRRYSDFVCEK
uniref:Uncharacterized protein n=1 Tax=Rhizophora mucronata TaxID=61149 RepID=A0A2P2LQZ8_RHIMU